MTLAQMRDMTGLLLVRDRGRPSSYAICNFRHQDLFDSWRFMSQNEIGQLPRMYDIAWHVGLECAITSKGHHGDKKRLWQLQQFGQRLDVLIILAEGILKMLFVPKDALCPTRVVLTAKNPALVGFGFHDKDAETGNDNVIDLRSGSCRRQHDIRDQDVFRRIESL